MPTRCPQCHRPGEPDARFCIECGTPLAAGDEPSPAPPRANAAPVGHALASPDAPARAGDVTVEVDTTRDHTVGHASLLRFRLTNRASSARRAWLSVWLEDLGRHVEQDDPGAARACLLEPGQRRVLSVPFRCLVPGQFAVRKLCLEAAPDDRSRRRAVWELPDGSLHVRVIDPAEPTAQRGTSIHVREMYGSDVDLKDLPAAEIHIDAMYGSDLKVDGPGKRPPTRRAVREPEKWSSLPLDFVATRQADDEAWPGRCEMDLGDGCRLELIALRAGTFTMGGADAASADDERPLREVSLTRDVYLAAFPVTQRLYRRVTGESPSQWAADDAPVDSVSWRQAEAFCRKLRARLLSMGDDALPIDVEDVRLPAEAEWEYACRAEAGTAYAFGDDRAELPAFGWFDRNAGRRTHAVGELKPNAWGFHDMHGNVWEWCRDVYAPYDPQERVDPVGPIDGERRVLRGGSWSQYARRCRSASRHAAAPDAATSNYGFRVVVVPAGAAGARGDPGGRRWMP